MYICRGGKESDGVASVEKGLLQMVVLGTKLCWVLLVEVCGGHGLRMGCMMEHSGRG